MTVGDVAPVSTFKILILIPHHSENKVDFSGMNHAFKKGITCFPWETCNLAPCPRGTEGNDFMLSAAYSPEVLKHGLSFERKDASFFSKGVARLSVARLSPGIRHKDICVSF